VSLAYEPECAIVASVVQLADRSWISPGHRVMVVDAGGGTVDISVIEIKTTAPFTFDSVREAAATPCRGGGTGRIVGCASYPHVLQVCTPDGGPWGA